MMTPKQAVELYLRDGDKEVCMATIQRDAREGMVAVEDVKWAVSYAAHNSAAESAFGHYLDALRAKHPNLFKTWSTPPEE